MNNFQGASIGRAKIQVIIIERPIDTWDYPLTGSVFLKTLSMKLRGYGQHHAYGVLPIDSTDYVADHIVIGDVSSGNFEPITGWRSITLDACTFFNHPFGPLHLSEEGKSHEHAAAVQAILDRYAGKRIRYCSSYTINPSS